MAATAPTPSYAHYALLAGSVEHTQKSIIAKLRAEGIDVVDARTGEEGTSVAVWTRNKLDARATCVILLADAMAPSAASALGAMGKAAGLPVVLGSRKWGVLREALERAKLVSSHAPPAAAPVPGQLVGVGQKLVKVDAARRRATPDPVLYEEPTTLGAALRAARTRERIDPSVVGELLGVDGFQWLRWESGQDEVPLDRIAELVAVLPLLTDYEVIVAALPPVPVPAVVGPVEEGPACAPADPSSFTPPDAPAAPSEPLPEEATMAATTHAPIHAVPANAIDKDTDKAIRRSVTLACLDLQLDLPPDVVVEVTISADELRVKTHRA